MSSEQNLRIHLIAAFFAVLLAFLLNVSQTEFVVIIVCIAAVIGMELMNTAIERLCDFVAPERHPTIKIIKDASAAAVLVVAIGALVAGLIIFIPRVAALLQVG